MLELQTIQKIVLAIRDAGRREVCGLVLRHATGNQEFLRLRNLAELPTSFEIGNSEVLRAERYAQLQGARIEAFIHSHHTTLELSAADKTSIKVSNVPWITILLGKATIRYRVFRHEYIEEEAETFEAPLPEEIA